MADETKKSASKVNPATIGKVVLGIVLIGLGVAATIALRRNLAIVVAGCIGPILILAGLIALAIAKE